MVFLQTAVAISVAMSVEIGGETAAFALVGTQLPVDQIVSAEKRVLRLTRFGHAQPVVDILIGHGKRHREIGHRRVILQSIEPVGDTERRLDCVGGGISLCGPGSGGILRRRH